VEFRNSGSIHALFSDGVTEPSVEKVEPYLGYIQVIERIATYLHE
jgi:hypothetical protein